MFITTRIASIFVSSTAVHRYDFHIFTVIIHLLEGLFGSNIMASSQLACWLKQVAEILGYIGTDQAIRKHIDSEDYKTFPVKTTGEVRNMIFIN